MVKETTDPLWSPLLNAEIRSQLRSLHPLVVPELPAEISSHFREAQTELSRWDKHIQNLENQIIELQRKQEKVQQSIVSITSLFSPVRRLPSEIIQDIFILASMKG